MLGCPPSPFGWIKRALGIYFFREIFLLTVVGKALDNPRHSLSASELYAILIFSEEAAMTYKISGLQNNATMLRKAFAVLIVTALIAAPVTLKAQTAGEGTITGTVTDTTGAAIPNATVTATNAATSVATTRTTSGAGSYTIAPLPPGIYSVQVSAKGFKTLRQDNLSVDALNSLGFNPVLTLGEATETVVVTAAPPVLDTTNATVGLVMENTTYANLPLQMNNAQRDARSEER